ncbi:MAG TPA: hypothetical protein VFV95_19335 [Vicinamibacterales bacterium]|nr:hypothetical protein [Vicinamibacterales bacterium]
MAAAMRALESFANQDAEEDAASNRLSEYIRDYAEVRGAFRDSVQGAIAAGRIEGDLQNAYADPALLAGLAFAWLMLSGGGTR